MELSWKDKYTYYTEEFKRKLLSLNKKIQEKNTIMGLIVCFFLFVGGIIVVLPHKQQLTALLPFVPPAPTSSAQSGSSSSVSDSSSSTTKPFTTGDAALQVQLQSTQQSNSKANTATRSATGTTIAYASSPTPTPKGSVQFQNGNDAQFVPNYDIKSPRDTTTDLSNLVTLYFPDDKGTLQPYVVPTTAPESTTWQRYDNYVDHYYLDFPIGWQVVKTVYSGHEGLAIYPPGIDKKLSFQDGLQEIGFGVSNSLYQLPYLDETQNAYKTTAEIDGYQGIIYTQSLDGANTIVGIFQYGNTYFEIGGTANTDEMIYVFTHMLSSLNLGVN